MGEISKLESSERKSERGERNSERRDNTENEWKIWQFLGEILENQETYWKIVGKAVTKNLPERPGDETTSTFPTLIERSSAHVPNSVQTGSSDLQAGHHGAKLEINTTLNMVICNKN